MGSNQGQPHSSQSDDAAVPAPQPRGRPASESEAPVGLGPTHLDHPRGSAPDNHVPTSPQSGNADFGMDLLASLPSRLPATMTVKEHVKIIKTVSKAQHRVPRTELIRAATPLGSVLIVTVGLVAATFITPFGWQAILGTALAAVFSGTVTYYARPFWRGRRQRERDAGDVPEDGDPSRRRADNRETKG